MQDMSFVITRLAVVGGVTGVISAIGAAYGWLAVVEDPRHRTVIARTVAGVCAAGLVLLISLITLLGLGPREVSAAIISGFIAFAASPRLGYTHQDRKTATDVKLGR